MHQLKIIVRPIALILMILTLFMLVCSGVALYYKEDAALAAFIKTISIILVLGIVAFLLAGKVNKKEQLSMRAGILLVVCIWVFVSLFGCLPYYFSEHIPNFADCFFESVSGFTTTGASILGDIEALPQSLILWRGLTHWIGGGGIIVLSVAVLPLLGIGGMQMMKAETTGLKLDKISPRIAETAKILWFLYVFLTAVAVALYLYGGMGVIDALTHAFSSIATGGLSSRNASIGHFQSPFIDWVTIVFMFIGAMNFVLIVRVFSGKFHYLRTNNEFIAYTLIALVATAIVSFSVREYYETFEEVVRYSAFQVISVYSTTGYSTADFMLWPTLAQCVIFILFFIGGCAGSTAGGVKVVRHVVMLKQSVNEMKYLIHPRGVFTIRLNGLPLETSMIHAVTGFFALYISSALAISLIISTADIDFFSAFTGTLAMLGTIGPGFATVGPTENYSFLPDYIKYTLSFTMLLGRLELYTLLIIFTPWFWKK